jgi:hypothetical protein
VNNNVPYIESPAAYRQKYGVIERVWVDREYTNATMLKAAAEKMLSELQEPAVEYALEFMDLENDAFYNAALGKVVQFEDYQGLITAIQYDYEDVKRSSVAVANKPVDIASTVADLANRQRIESTYSQGATQIFAQSIQANADSRSGAVLSFYLPTEMVFVNKVMAKIEMDSFRAYGRDAAAGGGGYYGNTATSSSSLDETGKIKDILNIHGSLIDISSSKWVLAIETEEAKQLVGTGARVLVFPRVLIGPPSDDQVFGWLTPNLGEAFQNHTHNMKHYHTVSMGFNLPDHRHDIVPGIYRFGNPSAFTVLINGQPRNVINGRSFEVDITDYLVDSASGMIPRGRFHRIEVQPNDLAYITISLSVQGFIQSRGVKTV